MDQIENNAKTISFTVSELTKLDLIPKRNPLKTFCFPYSKTMLNRSEKSCLIVVDCDNWYVIALFRVYNFLITMFGSLREILF